MHTRFNAAFLVVGFIVTAALETALGQGGDSTPVARPQEAEAPRANEAKPDANWPSFRGRRASGLGFGEAPPVKWDVEKGDNVRFRTALEGFGHGAPIVWSGKVYVLNAKSEGGDESLKVGLYGEIAPVNDESKQRWLLYCIDAQTGAIDWMRTLHESVPSVKRHTKASHANSTPATDGRHIVTFIGSEAIGCYDMEGKEIWKKPLGPLDAGYYRLPAAQWGFGSSPIIEGDRVYILCDIQKGSFIAALDLKTGKDLWKTERDEVPTWGTPTYVTIGERPQIVVNGYKRIGGYDARTGEALWWMRGGGDIPVPTPVAADGLVYVANAHGASAPVYAIKPGARGDVSLESGVTKNEAVVWSDPRCGSYMQTPLVLEGRLYACRDNGILSCYDAKSGDLLFRERLGSGASGFTASPVAAQDRLYFTGEEGEVHVVEAGPTFKPLGVGKLGEICMATPAIAGGALFFHTQHALIAIGPK